LRLDVNGTISAANFVGNGAGLTGVGTGSVNSGSAGQVAYYPNTGTAVVGTSTVNIIGGNVGIGTTAPQYVLDVNVGSNSFNLDNNGSSVGRFYYTATNGSGLGLQINNGCQYYFNQEDFWNNCPLTITGNGSSGAALTFNSSIAYFNGGNVGIGSTAPVNALDIGTTGGIHIASGTPGNTSYALYNNAGTLTWNGVPLGTSGSGGSLSGGTANYLPLWIGTNSLSSSAIYQSSGNIGIGTAAPAAILDVREAANERVQFIANDNGAYLGAAGIIAANDANTANEPLGFQASQY
jgi:hypothetical protein